MLQKPVIIPGSPPPAAIAPVPFQDTSWSCLAFCLWNPKPVDQAHLPIEGGETTQRNNIMQSLPPTPLSLSTKSIGGKSLATLSQKSPPPNLHGRQSLAKGYGHSPSFTTHQGPTCCCICQGRQSPAETKRLSPYALPSFCQVPHATFPPPGPNHPGSGEAGFWNQPAFFTPALARLLIFRPAKPIPSSWALTWRNQSGWHHQGPHSSLVDHQEGQESSLVSIPIKSLPASTSKTTNFLWEQQDIDHYPQRYEPKLLDSDAGEPL